MVAIALSILALAAGVYLLTYVKQFSLGGLYRNLSWLVILLALGFIACGVARGVMHMRCASHCESSAKCTYKDGTACPYTKDGKCMKDMSDCPMNGHGECSMNKDCCAAKMECCRKDAEGAQSDCCKKMKEAHGTCSEMHSEEGKACCKKGMTADSTAKK